MKLLVIETNSELLELVKTDERLGSIYGAKLLGTIEVTEPPKPKQTVTKKAEIKPLHGYLGGLTQYVFDAPSNAKNIVCTYEVEE